MEREDTPDETTLPPGERDPNIIYIAVGKAIHSWEGLEQAIARLALKLMGVPDVPANYPKFGEQNPIFRLRTAALQEAAQSYFLRYPDQALEGEFSSLVEAAEELSIERHRIAHGHITMWGEFKIPEEIKSGPITLTATMLCRWAPPFYGVTKLRTNPVGMNGASIDKIREEFEVLHNKIYAFTERIPELKPSPEK